MLLRETVGVDRVDFLSLSWKVTMAYRYLINSLLQYFYGIGPKRDRNLNP